MYVLIETEYEAGYEILKLSDYGLMYQEMLKEIAIAVGSFEACLARAQADYERIAA